MFDQIGWPRGSPVSVQQFTAQSAAVTESWQSWIKPRNAQMVYFLCVGAGAGGGGGLTGAAGSARGGGSGGGAGAITRGLVPACLLPEQLYLFVPRGGNGGAVSGAGSVGLRTYISLLPNQTAAAYLITISGAADAAAGVAGTATTNAGGAAGTIATAAGAYGHGLGTWTYVAGGSAGGNGGAGTGGAGSAVTWSSWNSGGAGGGGTPTANTDNAGGAITGAGLVPTINGGAAAAGPGIGGHQFFGRPLWASSGGSGGGTAGASGTAGAGGAGGFGSGGGGGGGGVTAGVGGRGGDGLVIIVAW